MPLPDPWLPLLRPRKAARLRLFCLPWAGGSASAFRGFQDGLPESIEVCAVQLPGREGRFREAPVSSLAKLVSMLADGLGSHFGPRFAFFGHSMGALLAFELARELRRRGAPLPVCLFASACPAPHIPDSDDTHTLSDDGIIESLRVLGGMDPELLAHRELMAMIVPIIRADSAVTETYRHAPGAPLDLPITAIGGLADEKATPADLDAWRQHTTAAFACSMVPGGHFFLQEQAATVLGIVARALA